MTPSLDWEFELKKTSEAQFIRRAPAVPNVILGLVRKSKPNNDAWIDIWIEVVLLLNPLTIQFVTAEARRMNWAWEC